MKDKILVVGGYGDVGKHICRDLSNIYPGKIIAAGRDPIKAKAFTDIYEGRIIPQFLDINTETNYSEVLTDVRLVIMCFDAPDASFAEKCFKYRTHYIDISATYKLLSQIKKLHSFATVQGCTGILSVGLAPGLTNLLAKSSIRELDKVEGIDIFVLLGLGDDHGDASIFWVLDNVNADFNIRTGDGNARVRSFMDSKSTIFPQPVGERKAYRFNFSDQQVLPKTLKVPAVSTWICFEDNTTTKLIHWLRASGLTKLIKLKPLRKLAKSSFSRIKVGSDIFALKIEAKGWQGEESVVRESAVLGHSEAAITASVATQVAGYVLTNDLPYGIFHIEELFDADEFIRGLRSIQIYESIDE